MGKKIVGIDINEVLRARWLQYDRYYEQEFGEEGIPKKNSYVYDLFNGGYVWKDIVETVKELKEPEDTPEHINPIDYQVDNRDGKAPADAFLFKKPEEIKLTAKEAYNRFMYEDFLFEIHGAAPKMYVNMDLHVNNFLEKYSNVANFIVLSVENKFSIPPTLFFLSKITSRFKTYQFVDKPTDMWKYVDVLITTDPEILNAVPLNKRVIKLKRPYNENCQSGSIKPVIHINDLFENQEFEKIINYIKPKIK